MSTTSVVKTARPPSTFAQLLRQSKFSSFDPRIGQIYTSHEGSAVRGDFGLKRPLTRRKGTRIRVTELDSSYQQTVWKRANSDADWMSKMEQLDVVPVVRRSSAACWQARLGVTEPDWLHDSDYAAPKATAATFRRSVDGDASDAREVVDDEFTIKGTRAAKDIVGLQLQATAPAPNPFAMDKKQFERYLKKVRNLGDDFKPFLAAARGSNMGWKATGPEPHYRQARNGLRSSHNLFLAQCYADECFAPDSTRLRPLPHPTAGFAYSQTSTLQDGLFARPVPGRRVYQLSRRIGGYIGHTNIVAVAGLMGREPHPSTTPPSLTDIDALKEDADSQCDVALFRPARLELYMPPRVVSKGPWNLDDIFMRLQVINWEAVKAKKLNPYRPGSREFVGCNETKAIYGQKRYTAPNFMQSVKRSNVQEEAQTEDLIGKLQYIIAKSPVDNRNNQES